MIPGIGLSRDVPTKVTFEGVYSLRNNPKSAMPQPLSVKRARPILLHVVYTESDKVQCESRRSSGNCLLISWRSLSSKSLDSSNTIAHGPYHTMYKGLEHRIIVEFIHKTDFWRVCLVYSALTRRVILPSRRDFTEFFSQSWNRNLYFYVTTLLLQSRGWFLALDYRVYCEIRLEFISCQRAETERPTGRENDVTYVVPGGMAPVGTHDFSLRKTGWF